MNDGPFSSQASLLDYICNCASENNLLGLPDRTVPWEEPFENWVEDLGRREGQWLKKRRATIS